MVVDSADLLAAQRADYWVEHSAASMAERSVVSRAASSVERSAGRMAGYLVGLKVVC